MRLLQLTGTLDPEFGGPPTVVKELSRNLREIGHQIDIVTLDHEGSSWLSGTPRVVALGGLGRYRFSIRLKPWLLKHATDYDGIIVHGLWQYQSRAVNIALRRASVPYFIVTHGALNPWFRTHHPIKHLKKSIYWRLFESRSIRDARLTLFTSEGERREASVSFSPYIASEAVVRIGITDPLIAHGDSGEMFVTTYPHLRGKRILLFLGRLHEVKGCDVLIRAFAAQGNDQLHLVIAGPDENDLARTLKMLSNSLGVGDRVTFTGMLSGDLKWGAYASAEALVLVSHCESFGMVVVEALACGLPVLISDKVTIWREVIDYDAGLKEAPTVLGATRMLTRWNGKSASERATMGAQARKCFLANFEARTTAEAFANTLYKAIGFR